MPFAKAQLRESESALWHGWRVLRLMAWAARRRQRQFVLARTAMSAREVEMRFTHDERAPVTGYSVGVATYLLSRYELISILSPLTAKEA